MKVIIAEKPDQGAKLAAPFSGTKKGNYIEVAPNDIFPKGAYVTWAVGHLCELVSPETYDPKWKKWSLDTLPIIPTKFQHQVMKSRWKQFQTIKDLVHRANVTEIIMAGDAGREGEAITRIILTQCRVNKPLKRLWISSLTKRAVENGFRNLLDEQETRNVYYEALSRACADWLVGINSSRAYTLLLQRQGIQDVFSMGRVQTPTLSLIVKREKEIEDFVSQPFWEVIAVFQIDDKTYEGKWHKDEDSRILEEKMAHAIATFCHGKASEITEVERERKEFSPPSFFQLSSLQATANKAFTFSPQKTLDIAQKLYVKGIISYPRTDSSFVTKEEAAQFPEIIEKIQQISAYKKFFPLPVESIMNNKRYVNEKKVTDHYAIIPTEQVVDIERLSGDEQKIYDLIIKRLLAAHYEKAIFDYTKVHTLVDDRATFLSKGKQMVQEGWRKIIYPNKKDSDDDEQLLPLLEKGEQGITKETRVKDGKTQPPKRYTEGQLITIMKTAGRYIEDEELTKVLNKTEGLGTEATRANIINVLKQREYIDVKKNLVYANDKGKLLIKAVGDSVLASPEMTAKWEQRLHEIGEGNASAQEFMEQVKKLSVKLIDDAKQTSGDWQFEEFDLSPFQKKAPATKKGIGKKIGACRKCDGDLIDKGSFYGCSNYQKNKCNFTISKKILGKTISQKNVKKLLAGEATDLIQGFKKDDKTFDAKLEWKDGKIHFIVEKKE